MITFLITMVNCGQPWDGTIVHQGWLWSWWPWLTKPLWNGTPVNHGWPCFCEMVPLSTMVDHAFVKWHHCQPWITMLMWNGTNVNHGWPCFCEMVPLSTMVYHAFVKWQHCQPWLMMAMITMVDHGQTMDKSRTLEFIVLLICHNRP